MDIEFEEEDYNYDTQSDEEYPSPNTTIQEEIK